MDFKYIKRADIIDELYAIYFKKPIENATDKPSIYREKLSKYWNWGYFIGAENKKDIFSYFKDLTDIDILQILNTLDILNYSEYLTPVRYYKFIYRRALIHDKVSISELDNYIAINIEIVDSCCYFINQLNINSEEFFLLKNNIQHKLSLFTSENKLKITNVLDSLSDLISPRFEEFKKFDIDDILLDFLRSYTILVHSYFLNQK